MYDDMSGLISYSGLTTKVRAIRGKMLKQEQFLELADCESVAEVIGYLKEKDAYRELFSSVNSEAIHRGNIEKLLKRCYYSDFEKLYRFSDMEQRKYLELYFKKFELSFLKSCLRNICRTNSEDRSDREVTTLFQRHSKLDAVVLQSETTIEGFVEKLKNTEYYAPLKRVIMGDRHTLFDYEAALDMYYFTKFWKEKKKSFKGTDAKVLDRAFGYKIDILNMQWIYRSKRFYQLSKADIYALLIPIRYRLTKKDIERMVEATDAQTFQSGIGQTAYKKMYPDISGENLEDMYIYLLDGIHDNDGHKHPYSVAILNSYLYRKEYEINKITTIMECIRYKVSKNDTIHYARLDEG